MESVIKKDKINALNINYDILGVCKDGFKKSGVVRLVRPDMPYSSEDAVQAPPPNSQHYDAVSLDVCKLMCIQEHADMCTILIYWPAGGRCLLKVVQSNGQFY